MRYKKQNLSSQRVFYNYVRKVTIEIKSTYFGKTTIGVHQSSPAFKTVLDALVFFLLKKKFICQFIWTIFQRTLFLPPFNCMSNTPGLAMMLHSLAIEDVFSLDEKAEINGPKQKVEFIVKEIVDLESKSV